jgi:hypothetical protein
MYLPISIYKPCPQVEQTIQVKKLFFNYENYFK